MKQNTDQYMPPITFEYPNMIIRVYRPILTDEERARRRANIEAAAIELIKSVEKKTHDSKSKK